MGETSSILRLFLFSEWNGIMLVHSLCKGGRTACYDSEGLVTPAHEPVPLLQGPFPSCKDCPCPGSGFLCYAAPGNCLRPEMKKSMGNEGIG